MGKQEAFPEVIHVAKHIFTRRNLEVIIMQKQNTL